MRKLLCLVLAAVCAIAALGGCGGGATYDDFLEIEGEQLPLAGMTVADLVDRGFSITAAELPRRLQVGGANLIDITMQKGDTAVLVKSMLINANVFEAEDMLAEAKTTGQAASYIVYLGDGAVGNGSYNGVAFADITPATVAEWGCTDRVVLADNEITYHNDLTKKPVAHVQFAVEEDASGSICALRYLRVSGNA